MNHRKFITRFVEYLSQHKGSIMLNEYEVNGARHCASEVDGFLNSAQLAFDKKKSTANLDGNYIRFQNYNDRTEDGTILAVEASNYRVKLHLKGDVVISRSYNDWNYTDADCFGSLMDYETPEEFDARCEKINAGLGVVQ